MCNEMSKSNVETQKVLVVRGGWGQGGGGWGHGVFFMVFRKPHEGGRAGKNSLRPSGGRGGGLPGFQASKM